MPYPLLGHLPRFTDVPDREGTCERIAYKGTRPEIGFHHTAGPSEEELDDMEMAFLEDMYELMQASHFRLLSEEDWDTAQDEQFTVSLSFSDPHQLILSFFPSHPRVQSRYPAWYSRLRVWHTSLPASLG